MVDSYSGCKKLTRTDTAGEGDRRYQRHEGDRLHDLLLWSDATGRIQNRLRLPVWRDRVVDDALQRVIDGSVGSAAMERARVPGSPPVAQSIEVWKAAQELPLSGRRMAS
jgi:hypothetical protein